MEQPKLILSISQLNKMVKEIREKAEADGSYNGTATTGIFEITKNPRKGTPLYGYPIKHLY